MDEGLGVEVEPSVEAVTRCACGIPRMADLTSMGSDFEHKRVLLAVHSDLDKLERLSRARSLLPEFVARRAPEHRSPGLDRASEREVVDVGDKDHVSRVGVLNCAWDDATDVIELGPVEAEDGTFLEIGVHRRSLGASRRRMRAVSSRPAKR